ncbi:hypothetical protein BO99DRAFT_344088, partial [Aspergillus violaceofuscus CBS 115571]
AHTTTGCGKQGFPSAQPYLSHTPGANPFCCMFLLPRYFNSDLMPEKTIHEHLLVGNSHDNNEDFWPLKTPEHFYKVLILLRDQTRP